MQRKRFLLLALFTLALLWGCSREKDTSTLTGRPGEPGPVIQAGTGAAAVVESVPVGGAEEAVGRPVIVFESVEFDFGEVEQGEEVEHVFSFKNTGTGELIVEKVRSS